MKDIVKVAKNTGWLVSAKFLSRILTALFIILLANHLLPSSFGIYNFVIAVSYFVVIITDWGFDELTVRDVSRAPWKGPKRLGDVLALRSFLAVITLAFITVIYHTTLHRIESSGGLFILLAAGGVIIFEKFSGTFSAQFQAKEKMEYQAFTTVIWKFVYLSLGISAIFLGYPLLKILFFLLAANIFYFLVSFITYLRFFEGSVKRPEIGRWPGLMKRATPFAMFNLTNVIYGHLIIVILAVLRGDFATGVYGASWKIVVFFGVVPHAFGRALYPAFSRMFTSSKKALRRSYHISLRYLLILSLPLTLGLYVIAPDVLSLIYASEYSPTYTIFKTLVWMIPFLFINGSLKMVLWATDKTVISARNLFLSSIVLGVLGVILVPQYGPYGAAVAVVSAEIFHFLVNYHVVTDELEPTRVSHLWRPYVSAVVMALILYMPYLLKYDISSLWLLPFAMMVYFLILYIIGGVDMDDYVLLKKVFGG